MVEFRAFTEMKDFVLCGNQNLVETEFHFILICSQYNDIINKYHLAKCN